MPVARNRIKKNTTMVSINGLVTIVVLSLMVVAMSFCISTPITDTHGDRGDVIARAGFSLGEWYRKDDTPQGYETALKLFSVAAKRGHTQAQSHLGFMYQNGLGTLQEDATALKWYAQSAKKGCPQGQMMSAVMYGNGHGAEVDYVRSYSMLIVVSQNPNSDKDRLNQADDLMQRVALKLTPDEVVRAQSMAKQWYANTNDQNI